MIIVGTLDLLSFGKLGKWYLTDFKTIDNKVNALKSSTNKKKSENVVEINQEITVLFVVKSDGTRS